MAAGFLAAGAPTVAASHWLVDDAATCELMREFYRAIILEKAKPSQALRQAQERLRNRPEYENPYFWGAFGIFGGG